MNTEYKSVYNVDALSAMQWTADVWESRTSLTINNNFDHRFRLPWGMLAITMMECYASHTKSCL